MGRLRLAVLAVLSLITGAGIVLWPSSHVWSVTAHYEIFGKEGTVSPEQAWRVSPELGDYKNTHYETSQHWTLEFRKGGFRIEYFREQDLYTMRDQPQRSIRFEDARRYQNYPYFDIVRWRAWTKAMEESGSRVLGFEFRNLKSGSIFPGDPLIMKNTTITAPLWLLVVLFGAWPALTLWKQIRQKQAIKDGYCPQCGYDLRATPDRCPECGHTVTAKVYGMSLNELRTELA